jgi:hypothetical protein
MALQPDEEATIRAFVLREKRSRYLSKLGDQKSRAEFLDRLNHCDDLNSRYATQIESSADLLSLLRSKGAPRQCTVISDIADLDGQQIALETAIQKVELAGFAAIICCIPGRLALYIDEAGTQRRLLLQR